MVQRGLLDFGERGIVCCRTAAAAAVGVVLLDVCALGSPLLCADVDI